MSDKIKAGDNPAGLERALLALNNTADPCVTDFAGFSGLYGVDIIELVTEYFKQFQVE